MKKLLCILAVFFALNVSQAQTEIKPKTNKIKTKKVKGYEMTLTGDVAFISDSWTKYGKTLGKYRNWLIYQAISELNIDFRGELLYSLVDRDGGEITLWLGASDIPEPEESDYANIFLNFEIQLRKDRAQREVDETQRAIDFIEKRQNKIPKEIDNLESKKTYNEKELKRLEGLIEENKLEYEVIKTKLENKRVEQDSLVISLEKVMKVMEEKKRKLKELK